MRWVLGLRLLVISAGGLLFGLTALRFVSTERARSSKERRRGARLAHLSYLLLLGGAVAEIVSRLDAQPLSYRTPGIAVAILAGLVAVWQTRRKGSS